MEILALKNVSKTFSNGVVGLSDINLSIEADTFLLITGKNGSGKTVLVRHLNGLYTPSTGKLHFKGQEVTVRSSSVNLLRRSVGLVFQNPDSQIVGQTVLRDVAFGPENLNLPGGEIEKRTAEAMAITGLSHLKHRQPGLLSGGEKKRLSIAGVLAMDPEVIILDEPFSNLDYPSVKQVLHCLVSLRELKKTVIVVTHELEKVLAHGERLIIMDQGKIAADGKPEDLVHCLRDYGVHLPGGVPMERLTWLD